MIVRPRSALGLKYVQITRGHSRRGFEDGATIPVRNATPQPVELDEFLNTFDDRTRAARAARTSTSSAPRFAGRGADLNRAIEAFNPLLVTLVPVHAQPRRPAHAAVAARSRRSGARRGSSRRSAETQAALFAQPRHDVRGARRPSRRRLQQTIRGGPPALDAATGRFPQTRPFLAQHAGAVRRAAARRAGAARPPRRRSPTRSRSARRRCERSVQLNARLEPTFLSIERLADDPLVALGVRDLTNTAQILNPTLATLTPAQTVCNYMTLWFRNVSSLLSEGGSNGTSSGSSSVADAAGPEQRGRPVVGAGQRRRPTTTRQLPAHEPVPEHRLARPAAGVRGGQRDVRGGPPGDRQRAGQPGHAPRRARRGARRSEPACAATPPDDATVPRRHRGRRERVQGRADRARRHRRRDVPRRSPSTPVHARLPRQGRLRVGEHDPARTRRCGSRA